VAKKWESLLPDREGLRRAVRWLFFEQPKRDAQTGEEASRRFDLSPLDEEFLLRHFLAPEIGKRTRGLMITAAAIGESSCESDAAWDAAPARRGAA
jgi:hypothetical protein